MKTIRVYPVTPRRWADLENMFGIKGACAGCWCMLWRLPRKTYENQKGSKNRAALKSLVVRGSKPGLIAYVGGQPAGWCALAPRSEYPGLERSRVLQPIDDRPVWSISCFFVAKPFRRLGLSMKLIEAAIVFVKSKKGEIVEAYPIDPGKDYPDTFAWTGLASAFEKAGFREVARRSATRPIYRYEI